MSCLKPNNVSGGRRSPKIIDYKTKKEVTKGIEKNILRIKFVHLRDKQTFVILEHREPGVNNFNVKKI